MENHSNRDSNDGNDDSRKSIKTITIKKERANKYGWKHFN